MATDDDDDDRAREPTLLRRREIEAEIAGPLIRGFVEAIGRDAALDVVRTVISDLARAAGADLAARLGDASLPAFAQALDTWKAGGALEIDLIESTTGRLSFNVTRCRYAEMYRALGLADLGGSLSCRRDFALIEGFNPGIALERSRTLMEGAPDCDFRFRAEGPAAEDGEAGPSPPDAEVQGRTAPGPDPADAGTRAGP